MPGIPLLARQIICSRSGDQMCRQGSRAHLSAEEELAAEESLSVYCKPVELYNILQRRSVANPLFLQRCLRYKLQEKNKKRIQMTVTLSGIQSDGLQNQSSFPIYIVLARPVSNLAVTEGQYSALYHFKRACILANPVSAEGINRAQATFILPEITNFEAEVKFGSLVILTVSCAGSTHPFGSTISTIMEGECLLGTVSMELLCTSLAKAPNLSFSERVEVMSTIDMQSSFIKLNNSDEDKLIAVQTPPKSEDADMPQQVEVIISAEEVGVKERSPHDSYSHNDIPSDSLSHIMRLRTGNIMFNYKYYNNQLYKTEVTEDFSCAFCSVKCASFKGLRLHLLSSHDLFHFEFWVTAEHQVVNVSVKTNTRPDIIADGVDPKQQTFSYCSKALRRRKPKSLAHKASHVHPLVLNSDISIAPNQHSNKVEDSECVQSVTGSNLVPSAMLQFAKTRKLSADRSDPRNRVLLQKRQFFHSHRAQPMAMEQVLSDRDSEDEVDDDVADLENIRLLEDFMDVTKNEKHMMHLWNSFVRKQRVLADGHIPWACEAFSKLHSQDLIQAPRMLWCWRLFMIKLWNHGLLDARTMNNCNKTLQRCQSKLKILTL